MGLAHTIVGIVGNVISFGLFLSPMPTFFQIYKKKAVEEFQPYPYLGTVMNCIIWIFYGLPFITKDNILVLTINGVGLGIEILYLTVYFVYANDRKKRLRVAQIIGLEALLTVGIVLLAIFVFHSRRTLMVGIIADVFNIIMYLSPLAIARKVIKTRSVEYMPFWLSLAAFSNGICWTIYGLLQFDIFILVSNGLGSISGFLQLCLYAYFYFNGDHKTKDQVKKPSAEVQLSNLPIGAA
ncbi:VEGETATIVE CELL EXPRESSED1 [Hibiscus trionum]|uniref:Bidirectional sugar transporter SWEET n=1 Tax=Hibiscus trionum TaxID=183268 RepID=A0A9W7LNX5_HIBTR|nr:VEGETATIVE CELL EXPRESSED1 [Hibiscus trionum]GMI70145.1 VEGETATIVE CELL EXPRESSED1 [Hibiscus trionum]GMI70148.1 VEGETATIVE CELL EXPRESSED1 [Hibiscus trionum]GMI70149.1 VEGETATIVE CELL EXPRESSED1 [Hibiscus trionum]GMI70150.1 VEGETATIVE CELL EXPRESSED1 [Hibiscus trionum]